MRNLIKASLFVVGVLPVWTSTPAAVPGQVRLAQAGPAAPAQAADPVSITEMGVERKNGEIRVTLKYQSDKKLEQLLVVGAVTIGGKEALLINARTANTVVAVSATGKVVMRLRGYTRRDSGNAGVLEFSFDEKAYKVYDVTDKLGDLRVRLFEADGGKALATVTRTGIKL